MNNETGSWIFEHLGHRRSSNLVCRPLIYMASLSLCILEKDRHWFFFRCRHPKCMRLSEATWFDLRLIFCYVVLLSSFAFANYRSALIRKEAGRWCLLPWIFLAPFELEQTKQSFRKTSHEMRVQPTIYCSPTTLVLVYGPGLGVQYFCYWK